MVIATLRTSRASCLNRHAVGIQNEDAPRFGIFIEFGLKPLGLFQSTGARSETQILARAEGAVAMCGDDPHIVNSDFGAQNGRSSYMLESC